MSSADSQPTALSPAEAWFATRGWQPFPFQREVWQAYLHGESGLIHAATGTGKTYAAWLGPLLEWRIEHEELRNQPTTTHNESVKGKILNAQRSTLNSPPLRVLWVTPLRALAADTETALREPLAALAPGWTLETRTGDTSSSVRARQRQRLPSALITTPESLSLLLARTDAATLFRELRLVVVDEWHELLGSKRGVLLELALARLRHWQPKLRTWGLSATLGNLEVALAALLGTPFTAEHAASILTAEHAENAEVLNEKEIEASSAHSAASAVSTHSGRLIQGLVPKTTEIRSIIPPRMERFPWAGHLGLKLLPQVLAEIEKGGSTLLFTNTRAQTEIWYQAMLDSRPEWAGEIALHHGSLDRDVRDWVEQGLREGRLRCVVCTSSLDLGVDFSPVDRVLHVGSPKGVARLLQRAGRSGHRPGAASSVTCVPTNAFELAEVAAVRSAALAGQIEARQPLERPLDVLAQHLVTVALGGGFRAAEVLREVRTSYAYRNLSDEEWRWTLDFVTKGGPALRAYPEYQRVVEQDGVYTVTDEAIARRHRMAIGTITSDAAITVQFLKGERLGTVEESFIARLKPGDKFTFAGRVLEFVRVREMTAWVRRAPDSSQAVPRWSGGRMALSGELATAVRQKLDDARNGVFEDVEMLALRPILALQAKWSAIPALGELLVERVQTRDGHHLFFYPFEGRLVHEGLAALFAYRISRAQPITFTWAVNDYGFELLSATSVETTDFAALQTADNLLDDMLASLNAAELAKRQFREIARVAGLVFPGMPGERRSSKHLQASSNLFYDVFQQYDPQNLLLYQARREVLERQLEESRLTAALARLRAGKVTLREVARPTPLAFPLLVDRLREKLSSEKLADRVRKMQLQLEKAAGES